ncbi:MAG: hypothetical protein D6785_01335 [Planctomycetota bacterium]|nr:MAG: hypothetical protein D6785_01335 [Planctomycetota bacterium]
MKFCVLVFTPAPTLPQGVSGNPAPTLPPSKQVQEKAQLGLPIKSPSSLSRLPYFIHLPLFLKKIQKNS